MQRSRLSLGWSIGVVPVALALSVWMAHGLVLPAGSALQKQRADVGKQEAKLVACLAKASIKCEEKGADSSSECNLANPSASTIADATAKAKFVAGVATCLGKVDLEKKSATGNPATDYTGIGCPGDADPNTSGDQPFADMNAFQANQLTSVPTQLSMLAPFIAQICGGGTATSDPLVLACMDTDAKALLKYGTSANKCQTSCENDYSATASKGGGGPNDSTTQCALTGGATTVFNLCVQAARDKLDAAAVDGTGAHSSTGVDLILDGLGMTPGLNATLDGANNSLYNHLCPP